MNVPTFSIVTPSLNQGRYIENTIKSVVAQEGEFEIEYFIMDGGSTDNSVEIIRDYADRVNTGRFPVRCRSVRIEWLSERDKGQSEAINRGLQRSTGDFASYLNSDDLYYAGAFARAARAFLEFPRAYFIYGDGDVIDESGARQWEWLSRPYNHRVMTSYHFLWNDFTNYIMQQATFWRSNVHARIGLLDEDFHYAMDVEYWLRAGAAGLTLVHIPEKLGMFRMIEGTKSLSSPVTFWNDYLELFRRYRGAASLDRFIGYFYFNLAMCRGLDLEWARQEGERSFRRWDSLPEEERRTIEAQRRRGFALARFLVAAEFQKQGSFERAAVQIRTAISESWIAGIQPLSLYCRLKQVLGRNRAKRLDGLADQFVAEYRRRRFDYRYHPKRSAAAV